MSVEGVKRRTAWRYTAALAAAQAKHPSKSIACSHAHTHQLVRIIVQRTVIAPKSSSRACTMGTLRWR